MSDFKAVGLTEEKLLRMQRLVYELLAEQKSEELGIEIQVVTKQKKAS